MSERRLIEGRGKLANARRAATSGRFALSAGDSTAETYLRNAASQFWSAMNWLQDSDGFEAAHDEIHEVGVLLRDNFERGCSLGPRDDGTFAHTCPVFLCHKRFGMSAGFTGNAICSICYQDASECPHIPGSSYEAVCAKGPWCNICGDQRCKTHTIGNSYAAEMGLVVTEATLHEVSLVARPVQPDNRIMEIPISIEEVQATYGRLPIGAYLKCDKCLDPCQGFDSMPSEQ